MDRPGNKEIQLDLFLDYASNVKLYPKFQEYFRKSKPPLLAIWGKNDPFFVPAGAEAFRKDLPNAQVEFLDTGHFATETHVVEILYNQHYGHHYPQCDYFRARDSRYEVHELFGPVPFQGCHIARSIL